MPVAAPVDGRQGELRTLNPTPYFLYPSTPRPTPSTLIPKRVEGRQGGERHVQYQVFDERLPAAGVARRRNGRDMPRGRPGPLD